MERTAKLTILAVCICIFLATPVFATTYTYKYSGDFINNSGLEHQKYYSWGLSSSQIPQNEDIVSATILFKGLYNWDNLQNHFYVNILGDAPTSPSFQVIGTDNPNDNIFLDNLNSWNLNNEGNAFVHDFALPYGNGNNATTPRDVSYTFTDVSQPSLMSFFNTAINDGIFGLGFDPDCHYWAQKIKLTLITEVPTGGGGDIPEPGTIVLLGSGLLGLGLYSRARLRK